jgi:hypothetical protein
MKVCVDLPNFKEGFELVTSTITDGTTTITFKKFGDYNERIEAVNFNPFAYPDNEGQEVIHEGQWFNVWQMPWVLQNDANFPSSGDSAADKYAALKSLIKSGGVNGGQFTITYDSEDSTPTTPQTESYTGKVKLLTKFSPAGKTNEIKGDLEFWESIS